MFSFANSAITKLLDAMDLEELVGVLKSGELAPETVANACKKSMDREPGKALFLTLGLALANKDELARPYLMTLLQQSRRRPMWREVSAEQLIRLYHTWTSTAYLTSWLEICFEKCISDSEQLLPYCSACLKRLSAQQRSDLFARAKTVREEIAMWYVCAGVEFRETLELVRSLTGKSVPWHKMTPAEFDRLIELLQTHDASLLADFVSHLGPNRFRRALTGMPADVQRQCITRAVANDRLREIAEAAFDSLALDDQDEMAADGFFETVTDQPPRRNLSRLELLSVRNHPRTIDFADLLLSMTEVEIPWNDFERQSLRTYVQILAREPDSWRFMNVLSADQIEQLARDPGFSERTFAAQFALERKSSKHALPVAELLAGLWEACQDMQPTAAEIAKHFEWSSGDELRGLEGALRRLFESHLESDHAPSQEFLDRLAERVGGISIRLSIAVANLMSLNPSSSWELPLKNLWMLIASVNSHVQSISFRREKPELLEAIMTVLDIAGFATADALVKCTLAGEEIISFDSDRRVTEPVTKLDEQIEPLVRTAHELGDEHDRITKQLRSQTGYSTSPHLLMLEEEIEKLEKLYAPLQRRRANLWRMIQTDLSPGWQFLDVVRRSQRNAEVTVQAAIGALLELLNSGQLDLASAQEIRETIQKAVGGDKSLRQFRERAIRLLPGSSRFEASHALHEGFNWMIRLARFAEPDGPTSLVESRFSQDSPAAECAKILVKRCPGFLQFMERHPLNLMFRADLRDAWGIYRDSGANIEQWYSYHGSEEDGGRVTNRFLRLNDRTRPNSIGVYYRLIQHPLLACPVMYHEMLHYGGFYCRPDRGISNELHVLIGEIAFAQGLLAELAPDDDDGLPAFEAELIRASSECGHESVLIQYLPDVSKDSWLEVNNKVIPAIYSARADESSEAIQRWNRVIDQANDRIMWTVEVRWPRLGTDETEHLTAEYLRLREAWTRRDHHVSRQLRDQVLKEEIVQQQLSDWKSYRMRPGALNVLKEFAGQFGSEFGFS